MTILGGSKNIESLMEAYVGNNRPEFKIIESELKKLINIVNKKYQPLLKRTELIPDLSSKELNSSDHNKLIEKMFKKIFNLKGFSMNWYVTAKVNASTPCKTFMLLDPNFAKDAKGHRTNDELLVGVNMYTGLITYSNLNEKELLAVILHEIGHNFYNSIFQVLSYVPITLKDLVDNTTLTNKISTFLISHTIFDIFGISQKIHKLRVEFFEFVHDELPLVSNAWFLANDLMSNLALTGGRILSPEIIKNIISNKLNPFRAIANYNVEKHADSFAVDYGYGKELSSALNKFRIVENSALNLVYQYPGLNWFLDLTDLQISIVSSCISGYPLEQDRIRTNLNRLKRNVKKESLDPQMRKVLDKQIKDFEEFYFNEYLDISSNENKNRVFTWLYNVSIEKMFGGKIDPRELVHAIDPHKYK